MARITRGLPRPSMGLWLVLIAAMVVISGGVTGWLRPWSSDAPEIKLPSIQREQPAVQPVQQAPVVAPVKEWPKVQVQWQRVAQPAGVTVFTKIDDGFYAGTSQNAPYGSVVTPEGTAFGKRILPQLERATSFLVRAARDPVDKNVVLVSLMAGYEERQASGYRDSGHMLISVDGGTSWSHLNLPPEVNPRTSASAVRVTADGDNIYPIVRGSNVAEEWYGTTIKRSGLSTP